MGRIVRDPTANDPYVRALRRLPAGVVTPVQARRLYLLQLADDYGVPFTKVQAVAELLGPGEDFDALIVYLDEMSLAYL